jgi:hypothetical protein
MRLMGIKTDMLHIRMPPDELAKLNAFAQEYTEGNTSMAARILIRAGLKAMGVTDAPADDAPPNEEATTGR